MSDRSPHVTVTSHFLPSQTTWLVETLLVKVPPYPHLVFIFKHNPDSLLGTLVFFVLIMHYIGGGGDYTQYYRPPAVLVPWMREIVRVCSKHHVTQCQTNTRFTRWIDLIVTRHRKTKMIGWFKQWSHSALLETRFSPNRGLSSTSKLAWFTTCRN